MTNNKFVAENASGNVDDFAGIRCAWKTVDVFELEKDCVRIQVRFSSVNYKDALAVTGKGKILRALPLVPGIDASGTVLESHASAFKVGDEVLVTGCGLGEHRDGGYSQIIDVPASWIIKKPENLSLTDVMILGTAGFTAGLALHQLHLNGLKKSDKPVLVTGASGGVGSIAIMMLQSLGYITEAWTRKESEVEYLKSIGADIVTHIKDLNTKTRPLDSAVWAAAIDNVGGDILSYLLSRIEPQGSVATVGMAKSMELNTTVFPFILRGVNILGVSSTTCPRPLREIVWSEINSLKVDWHKCLKSTLSASDIQPYCQKMIEGQITGRALVDARTF